MNHMWAEEQQDLLPPFPRGKKLYVVKIKNAKKNTENLEQITEYVSRLILP